MPESRVVDGQGERELKHNAIGLLQAAMLGIVFISPALGFYGNWGPVAATSGGVAPLVFLIGAAVIAPTALSYAFVARRLPSAGSAFAWAGHSINRHVGSWLGWMMLPYYILVIVAPAALFGLFFNALLSQIGLDVSLTQWWTYAIAVVFVYAVAAYLAYQGIESSVKAAVLIVSLEVLVILVLAITILADPDVPISGKPFDPSFGDLSWNTLWFALPLAVFSFLGMDAISLVSEETKLARRAIPRATLLSVGLLTLFVIFSAWAFSFAVPVSDISDLVASGITPVTPIAAKYWSGADWIVSITGLTAGMGATLAIMVGASRILFAMSRQGVLPQPLSRVRPDSKTPVNAMVVVLAIGLPFNLIMGAASGALNTYAWAGTAVVFFALVTYVFVNIGNFRLHWQTGSFNPISNGLIPVLGVGLSGLTLYKGFLEGLWKAGWVTIGRSILLFCLVWTVLGLLYAYSVRRRAREFTADVVEGHADSGLPVEAPATI